MNTNNHLVIMAGGVGSRFWPLSNDDLPKQFLDVLGVGRTLIQLTAERFHDIVPTENIWVVTNRHYADLVQEQLPDVPRENILLEPCRRNTAPCICYASWCIKKKNPRATIVVTPSDHIVMDNQRFADSIRDAVDFASETDAIVTLGMKPTRPETGYGYIKADLTFASSRKKNLYRVDAFKEKPTREVAEQYLQDSSYFWNAGIFPPTARQGNGKLLTSNSLFAKAFLWIMPFWRRRRKSSFILLTSDGATSARGARCRKTFNATAMATQ